MSENLPDVISFPTFMLIVLAVQVVFWAGFFIGASGARRLTRACKQWEDVVQDYKRCIKARDDYIARLTDYDTDEMRLH